MRLKAQKETTRYSYLIDNIKVLLIFLVVFNHLIAFQLVKVDIVVRYIWYAITIFHMPAFIFVSGYLSKKPQSTMKNFKNLMIPYILGYTLTWYAQVWLGKSVSFELLRPSGTVMWYLLALFVYRLTIEAMGKIRFIVPLSIIFALWAGTRPEFTTYLSTSRIVVFFPFFVAGYLWKSEYITAVRRFKGKWIMLPISGFLLYAVPNYMIKNELPIDIFRGNHTYLVSGLTDGAGIILRSLMYLVSFALIVTFLALLPNIKLPTTFIGRNTMGIYFFHYPIMIVANGLLILKAPKLLNVWVLFGISWGFVLILGSLPVDWLYTGALKLISFLIFKKEKKVEDEALEDEYDNDEDKYKTLLKRRKAIEELAAQLDTEEEPIQGAAPPRVEEPIREAAPPRAEEPIREAVPPRMEEPIRETAVPRMEEPIREAAPPRAKAPIRRTAAPVPEAPASEKSMFEEADFDEELTLRWPGMDDIDEE